MALVPDGMSSIKVAEKWLSDQTVQVIVGGGRQHWTVHENLLSSQSDYLRKAFRELEKNESGEKKPLEMLNEDPKYFGMTIRWVYGQAFSGRHHFAPVGSEGGGITVRDYIALYLFAHKLGIEGLKNAAIDVIYEYFFAGAEPGRNRRCPNTADIQYVFRHTESGSQLRCLVVVAGLFYLFSERDTAPGNPLEDWEETFRADGSIGWEFLKMLGGWGWVMGRTCPGMLIRNKCNFHEHSLGSTSKCHR